MRRAALRCLITAVAAVATASGIACAPNAGADPRDWVPWCSGNQTPADSNCREAENHDAGGNAPGANPNIPLGVNPELDAVTGTS